MYRLVSLYDSYTEELTGTAIVRLEDNAWIPKDPANKDYQEYLQWCSEGNTPEVAE